MQISKWKIPWHANIVNYLVCRALPPNLSFHQRKKFLHDVRNYFCEESLLYNRCFDGLIWQCTPYKEINNILTHYHSLKVRGHFSVSKIVAKILQYDFYWLTLFQDTRIFVSSYDRCQWIKNISKRAEMPFSMILEVELFQCLGDRLYRTFFNILWEPLYFSHNRLCI